MRIIRTVDEWTCDRCGRSTDNPKQGWIVADSHLVEAPAASVVYHFCPECRESLGMWFAVGQPDTDGNPGESTILERLINILYPLDEYRDTQWNGGDVCEAVARIVDDYAPDAKYRQPEEPPIVPAEEPVVRYCMETIWESDDVRAVCALPLHHAGDHSPATPANPEAAFEAYRKARREAGL